MSTASAMPYTYAYRHASAVEESGRGKRLALATSTIARSSDFFEGRLLAPRRTADQLLTISDVVGSRFHVPSSMLEKILRFADPVFTCETDRLRFEGFSACCGAYARLDLLPAAYEGRVLGTGTSNVDFGPEFRAQLGRIRDGDAVELGLRADAFELRREATTIVERKVSLPARWLRGFIDVQAYQSRMQPRFAASGIALRRFLRDVPAKWKGAAWLSASDGALRVTERAGDGAIRVGGISRLRVLRTIAHHVASVRVFDADDSGATAWELTTPDSRFFLVLSPDVWRGFSGEGQALDAAAGGAAIPDLTNVRAASGLVGYDLAEGAYFHRELPFDIAAARRMQPRLRNAERLIDDGCVRFEDDTPGEAVHAWVAAGDVEYRVTIAGGNARCTCPWYAKHRDSRGPCKHVLAVRMKR